ncbi:MAG: LysR family transcriptional regulator [Burkholderiaceae bacterium]
MPKSNIDITLWRALLSISETGSLTATAEILCRTPSAISMQIKRFEELVGVRLFIRQNTGIILTTAGKDLLDDYGKRIIELNDDVFRMVNRPEVEVIRLGMPDDYAALILPTALATYYESFQNVEVQLTCKTSHDLIPLAFPGKLDLVIIGQPSSQSGGIFLRTETLHWVCSRNRPVDLSECIPLVVFSKGCVCRNVAQDTLSRAGRRSRIVFSSKNNCAIYSAVRAGAGITVSEKLFIPSDVCEIHGVNLPELSSIDIVAYTSADSPTSATLALLDHIRRAFDHYESDSIQISKLTASDQIPYVRDTGFTVLVDS